jgi:hypothetical protein
MTVRCYDAAKVEKPEALHKRMGGSLNAFPKSLIWAVQSFSLRTSIRALRSS